MNRQILSSLIENPPAAPYFKRSRILHLIASLLLVIACACGSAKPNAPASSWPASTPEAQGMDSALLLKMLDFFETEEYNNVHSVLVIRHGKAVLEVYFPPFQPQDKHMQMSATKSFTSALVGIAVMEGKIQDVNQPVVEFFAEAPIDNMDERKEKMTVRDLLNMTSGLSVGDFEMVKSQDWSRFTLDQPMASTPGASFVYLTGNTQLLSSILQITTGQTAEAYAREKLFKPLGIEDYYWAADPSGTSQGGIGLMLTPRDMAKLGYLYLHQGKWEGKQIIPATWVEESIRPNSNGYAYQWWQTANGFMAAGYAGQFIYVMPEKDLIVVSTAGLREANQDIMVAMADSFIVGAVKSDQALPQSPDAQKLADRLAEIASPDVGPVPALPAVAGSVSGKTLSLEDNDIGWETAQLEFTPQQAWLSVKTARNAEARKLAVGLDDRYLLTETARSDADMRQIKWRHYLNPYEFNFLLGMPVDGAVAMKGKWAEDGSFTITIQHTRDMDRDAIRFEFTPEGAEITWDSLLDGRYIIRVNGRFE